MSDTMIIGQRRSGALGRHTGRILALAVSLVLTVAIAVVATSLVGPTSSTEPAREGTAATTAVAERIDCWPGRPC